MKHTLLISAYATLMLGSCSEKEPEKPNILWITCEDISPAWGCYGDEQAATPNIDALAEDGYIFTRAFSNAPICSPARSTLITGMYATSLGTQNLRSEIPVPDKLQILPELLRGQGYYTTNNAKTDYNFSAEGRWHENSNEAHWRNRKQGQPFYSVFNFGITHEGNANRIRAIDTAALVKVHQPENMQLPPYFPETEEFKKILAHQYNLISLFDYEVGKLVSQLKEDGLYDNTIIFVFSDHGYGLPRHKRWLYQSGTHVPFVMHVPEKYIHLVDHFTKGEVDQMLAFVDFAPSVLSLAGMQAPAMMQGVPFLGENHGKKEFVFGYRDRADDVYDMSRSINDGKFRYIRNYMPHKPYIQNAVIFNVGKRSYNELHRLKESGELRTETMQMFKAKAFEELYDIQNDPYELHNLAENPEYQSELNGYREKLKQKVLKIHDTGLMNEGDMIARAAKAGVSVYEMANDTSLFKTETAFEAAELVGRVSNYELLLSRLNDSDAAVRFWALHALLATNESLDPFKEKLVSMQDDPSVPNAALAAEILINKFNYTPALQTLKTALQHDLEPVVLQAAIATRNIGAKAAPMVPFIQNEVYPPYKGNVWGRYRSWIYPMFIGMSFDQTFENCGYEVEIKK